MFKYVSMHGYLSVYTYKYIHSEKEAAQIFDLFLNVVFN